MREKTIVYYNVLNQLNICFKYPYDIIQLHSL